MDRPEHASTSFLRILAAACRAHALDAARVLADAGVPPELLERRDGRVPLKLARAAWEQAVVTSGDLCFGLHAAERLPSGSFDLLGYLGRSAATLGEMFDRVAQLGSALTEDGALTLSRSPKRVVLRHSARAPLRQVSELLLAALVVGGRDATGVDWSPASVGFIHAAPDEVSEHARIFRAPVRFGQPADELYLPIELMALPLRTFEPQLSSILEDYARLVLGRTNAATNSPSVLSDVSDAIGAALPRGEPRLEDVARALTVTPRTLQRRLHAAGTRFQSLLDHVRHQLALQYLEDRNLPTNKLSLMLGFSEPSAFYRAYKRWTGESLSRSPGVATDSPAPTPTPKRPAKRSRRGATKR